MPFQSDAVLLDLPDSNFFGEVGWLVPATVESDLAVLYDVEIAFDVTCQAFLFAATDFSNRMTCWHVVEVY